MKIFQQVNTDSCPAGMTIKCQLCTLIMSMFLTSPGHPTYANVARLPADVRSCRKLPPLPAIKAS